MFVQQAIACCFFMLKTIFSIRVKYIYIILIEIEIKSGGLKWKIKNTMTYLNHL